MTTIVFTETAVAWDSQDTFGGMKRITPIDKVVVINNTIYGCAGESDKCEEVPRWHSTGADLDKLPDGNWEMICVTLDEGGTPYAKFYSAEQPFGSRVALPIAIGSGCKHALTAVMLGKDPKEAVEHAAELDIYTGHPVRALHYLDCLTIPDTRPLLRKKKKKAKKDK